MNRGDKADGAALKTQAEIIAEIIDNLKCCGNCAKKDCINFFSFSVCDEWESDLLTRNDRIGKEV